ncbi:MAG: hypothetical protein COA67_03675 [Lutibacter sp.]|nr:MAG: hypothetical protein COA67_03675 [Lutibacter sp.]
MKVNKNSFFLILLFIAYFTGYTLLIPTYENPDESRHLWKVFNVEKVFEIGGNGGLYYVFQKGVSNIFGYKYKKSYDRKNVIKEANPDFSYFANEYRYKHKSISPRKDILTYRFANLIVLIPLFFWFLKEKKHRMLFTLSLCFPGFVWFLTSFNPDIFNIAFSVILFKYRDKSKWLILGLLILAYLILDRSIILLILALLIYYTYQFIPKGKYLRLIFWLLFGTSLIVFHDFSKNIISYNYEYEPIKSIFTAIISFYGLLGNMSIKATFFEYFSIITLIFVLVLRIIFIKKDHPKKEKVKEFSTLILIYFILWAYLLTLVPTLDQGRYFYPIIFYLMYLIKEVVLKKQVQTLTPLLLLGMTINGFMFVKLFYVYFTQ